MVSTSQLSTKVHGTALHLQHAPSGRTLRHRLRNPAASINTNTTSSSQQGAELDASGLQFLKRLGQGTAASALILALVAGPSQAHVQVWKPRRHHRRMGERFLDTWAAEQIEIEEAAKDRQRTAKQRAELQRQQQAEAARLRKIEEDETNRKRAQKLLSQQAANTHRPVMSVRVAGVDIVPYVVWTSIAIAIFITYKSRILARFFGGQGRASGGRWVYDRSLGGKKVWVPEGTAAPEGYLEDLPQRSPLAERDFDRIASLAASASQGAAMDARAEGGGFQLPDWWDTPPVQYASPQQQAYAQSEAERIVRRLERLKNVGQDYPLSEIVALRRICQEGNVNVEAKTKGGRDAIFGAAVEAAVLTAMDPALHASDIGDDHSAARFVSGVAKDINMPEERAIATVTQAVAKAVRLRLVDAVTGLRGGRKMEAVQALVRLTTLLAHLPVLQPRSLEVALLASSLQDSSSVEERQSIFLIAGELLPEGATVLAAMLGFDPDLVVPQLMVKMSQGQPWMQQVASEGGGGAHVPGAKGLA